MEAGSSVWNHLILSQVLILKFNLEHSSECKLSLNIQAMILKRKT